MSKRTSLLWLGLLLSAVTTALALAPPAGASMTVTYQATYVEPYGGPQQSPQLQLQQCRPLDGQSRRTPAHGRVVFFRLPEIGERLVGANIERADRDRPVAGSIEHRGVMPDLRIEARQPLRHHEVELGAIKPDPIGARFRQMR